jgi:hypothetical protein
MNQYPGYNEDPRIKRSIDKCKRLGFSIEDFKQKKSPGKWYNISTIRGSVCTPKYGVIHIPRFGNQVQVGAGPQLDVDITHLYHHSSVKYLQDILVNGLITRSPYQYSRKNEDDHEQLIFFNYLAQGTKGIFRTTELNMKSSNIMFVLNYKQIYADYSKGNIGSLQDISIYPDLRNFDDMLQPLWTQHKQESERQQVPDNRCDEIVFGFGWANPPEKGFLYFPISKYIECMYTVPSQTHIVAQILKDQGLKIKVYTVQNSQLKPTDVFDSDPRYQHIVSLCQDKKTNKATLQALATKYNLPKSGSKQEICNRLLHFVQF